VSHAKAFANAKVNKYKSFLLLEDDIEFHDGFNEMFDFMSPRIPDDWDMLYLCANPATGSRLRVADNVFRLYGGYSAHCVIFKDTVYEDALNALLFNYNGGVNIPNYLQSSIATTITVQPKDIVSGGNTSGGKTLSLPYFRQDIADGFSAGNAFFVPNTDQTIFYSPYNGSLVSISLALNDTRTAGLLNLRPLINGVADDDLKVVINGTNTQYASLNIPVGRVPVTAGQRIGIYYDTDASWNTTGAAGTVDASVVLVFQTQ
jgi:hypothetical protein